MLRCRERRAEKQTELIARHGLPVACFTMNIPGATKRTPLIELAFREGVKRFERLLPPAVGRVFASSFTGCEAYFVFDMKAKRVKAAALAAEEEGEVSRLYDIDVIDVTGEKLSRGIERRCIVCGGPVAACARSRAHGMEALAARTNELLSAFAAQKLAVLAYDALVAEVGATPKPGLVDRRNSGAHRDMNIDSFYRSAEAIAPHFERMASLALRPFDEAPETLARGLRAQGLMAEEAMRGATKGVNTHKGAIFSMGMLLAGACVHLQTGRPARGEAARLASVGMGAALAAARANPATNGERVYAKTGASGARGEAAGGFPAAMGAKAALEGFLKLGYPAGDAAALTLSVIMEKLYDTNLVHRGGEEGLLFAQREAARINKLPAEERLEALMKLDDAFIERNLSPGGSADVLSLALLLSSLSEYMEI